MSLSKPYLDRLSKTPDGVTTTLGWARYLGETFGMNGALTSLKYYEHLGWISSAVRTQMAAHLQGLSLSETHNKKYDEPVALDSPLDDLSGSPFSAHAKSLTYIASIAGHDLEEHMLTVQMAKQRAEFNPPQDAQSILVD